MKKITSKSKKTVTQNPDTGFRRRYTTANGLPYVERALFGRGMRG